MSICLNSSLCFNIGDLIGLSNSTGQEQLPFSGYGSEWLAGVIISSLVIIAVLLWTVLQSKVVEKKRIKFVAAEARDLELHDLNSQYMDSAVQINSMGPSVVLGLPEVSVEEHIQTLNDANAGELPMSIEFQHLCLTLMGGKGKMVLENASGVLAAASLTAILGPSGSGKTSLLTAIAGRANYGKLSGVVKVNDVEQDIEKFRTVVGFVPQDDIMIRTLTVRQILSFSAVARLPSKLSYIEKQRVVDSVIALLGLEKIQHEKIGDENVRGISGGQKKRVNIGIELVSAPLALFLDEPTSGLDASSSFEVVSNLARMKPLNMNIVAVVHQPRVEVFNLFDRIVLLSAGGRTVYSGKRDLLLRYFEGLGFTFSPLSNPADEILDIITGVKLPASGENFDFALLWDNFTLVESQNMRKPTMDHSDALVYFQEEVRKREAIRVESFTPLTKMTVVRESSDMSKRRVMAVISFVFLALAIAVCIILLCLPQIFTPFTYKNVIIPYCSTALIIYSAIFVTVFVAIFSPFVAMEKLMYLSAGSALGPFGVIFGLVWYKRSRFYSYWLFLDMGAGLWITLVFAAIGTYFAISSQGFSESFSFTTDARVPWMLFMCAPFGFVIVVISISRIFKGIDSSYRDIAPFFVQTWVQFVRCAQQQWSQPSGVLLDFILAAVSACMIGIVTPTSSRWRLPLLESIAIATQGTPFPITNCPRGGPPILCTILSVPQSDPLFSNAQFVALALGLIGVISSLRYFGTNKENFHRENMSGLSTSASYIAKTLFLALLSAASSAIFLSFYGFLVQPPAPPGLYFLLFWVTLFAAQGLGFLVSISVRLDLAGMLGILVVLIFTLFSTTLSGDGSFQSVISYFSFVGWSSVAFYTTSVQGFNAVLTPWMKNVYGFIPDNQAFAWAQLFCLGVFMRSLAWMSLVLQEN